LASEYEKMDMLYQEKHRLEEHIVFLYDEWAKA